MLFPGEDGVEPTANAIVAAFCAERLPGSNRLVSIFAGLSKPGNMVVTLVQREQLLGKEASTGATTSTRLLRPRRTPVRIR
jgi:hypothetical protein